MRNIQSWRNQILAIFLTDGKGLDVLDPNSANTSLDLNQDKQLIAYFKTDPTYNPDDFLSLINWAFSISGLRLQTF